MRALLISIFLYACGGECHQSVPTNPNGPDGGPTMVCARPCSNNSQCNPSVWQVCEVGCCVCRPPDGGTCP